MGHVDGPDLWPCRSPRPRGIVLHGGRPHVSPKRSENASRAGCAVFARQLPSGMAGFVRCPLEACRRLTRLCMGATKQVPISGGASWRSKSGDRWRCAEPAHCEYMCARLEACGCQRTGLLSTRTRACRSQMLTSCVYYAAHARWAVRAVHHRVSAAGIRSVLHTVRLPSKDLPHTAANRGNHYLC